MRSVILGAILLIIGLDLLSIPAIQFIEDRSFVWPGDAYHAFAFGGLGILCLVVARQKISEDKSLFRFGRRFFHFVTRFVRIGLRACRLSGRKELSSMTTFQEISMRGRVAYSLMCLEEAIQKRAKDPVKWVWPLRQLWSYTSTTDLEEWMVITSEILPSVVIGEEDYGNNQFKHLTPDQFVALRELYNENETFLGGIVELVFDIGTSELYGGIKDGGQYSLAKLGKLDSLMADCSLDVPDISALFDKSFDQQHGWGNRFQPGALSRMVGMNEEKPN
jgi:hypothetical protein